MEKIRVRALSNVLGLHYGDEDEVYPNERIEAMIRGGHLVWLDDPDRLQIVPTEDAEPVVRVVVEGKPRRRERVGADTSDPKDDPMPDAAHVEFGGK